MKAGRFLKNFVKNAGLVLGGVAFATPVFAFTTPDQDSFFYDIYDYFVKKIVAGPIGFAAGVGMLVWGASRLVVGNLLGSILPILGGVMLVKAESLAKSLGATIAGM